MKGQDVKSLGMIRSGMEKSQNCQWTAEERSELIVRTGRGQWRQMAWARKSWGVGGRRKGNGFQVVTWSKDDTSWGTWNTRGIRPSTWQAVPRGHQVWVTVRRRREEKEEVRAFSSPRAAVADRERRVWEGMVNGSDVVDVQGWPWLKQAGTTGW